MSGIAGLLLAAGESLRMGTVNKLLLPVSGKSFVRHAVEQVLQYPFQEVLVVTGHQSDLIETEVDHPLVRTIFNKQFKTGMHSSIRAGLRALQRPPEGIMICLSDQPLLQVGLIEKLAQEFLKGEGPRIVFPQFQAERGHPVFISHHFISEILNEPDGDHGCRYLFQRHGDCLFPVVVEDISAVTDIDTLQQYQALGLQI